MLSAQLLVNNVFHKGMFVTDEPETAIMVVSEDMKEYSAMKVRLFYAKYRETGTGEDIGIG